MGPEAVIWGASGYGKVVADLAACAGAHVLGFLDDDEAKHGSLIVGSRVLGGRTWLGSPGTRDVAVALGIGHNGHRRAILEFLQDAGFATPPIVHPRATVAASATLGPGTVVLAGAVVNAAATCGSGVIVNTGAIIEHDCVVGDFAHVSPGAQLGGNVTVGAGAHIGLGASVLPGRRVGRAAVVGAGAVVTRDVDDEAVVIGVPARPWRLGPGLQSASVFRRTRR